MLSRRSFIRKASATATAFYLIGCGSASAISALVSTIANYGAQLASYFGASSVATQITTIASLIATDINQWVSTQSQTAAQGAIQALNDLMGLIQQINIPAKFQILADLLIGAAEGLLALLPSSTASATPKVALKRTVAPTYYRDAKRGTMEAAKTALDAQWAKYAPALLVQK